VRAQDFSTGQFDGNTKVLSSAPDGPGNGPNSIFLANFTDSASFADWTVTTGPGAHSCGEWSLTSSSSSLPSGGSGQYVWANSNCGGIAPRTSASLDSPPIDGNVTDILSITLQANIRYTTGNGDDTTIEVWDGGQWVVIWNDPNTSFNGQVSFDVTQYAAGNSNFRVRFNYQNANVDGYFAVDNVNVIADLLRPCSTEAAGPAPAPDGSLGTTPLRGDRLDVAGSSIDVSWDATTCGAAEFNLLWGDLAGVSSYALGGAECSIGSGSYTWTGVPSGDLYFIVVATDGAGVESGWGTDGGGAERNGSAASGECATTAKNPSGACP
jgi:hypothetical protein